MRHPWVSGALAGALLAAAAACGPAAAPRAAIPSIGSPAPLSIRPATPSPSPRVRTPQPTPRPGAPVVTVFLRDNFFDPAALTVGVGTTVTWRVVGQNMHDVVAMDGSFQVNGLGPGHTFSHTFTEPGRYSYFCVPHFGGGMRGEIVVE